MTVGEIDVSGGIVGNAEGIVQLHTVCRSARNQRFDGVRVVAGNTVQVSADRETVDRVIVIVTKINGAARGYSDATRVIESSADRRPAFTASPAAGCTVARDGIDVSANRKLPDPLVVVVGESHGRPTHRNSEHLVHLCAGGESAIP